MDATGLEKWQNVLLRKILFSVGGWWEGGGQGMEGDKRKGSPELNSLPLSPPFHPNSTHIRSSMRFCLFSRDV